MNRKTQMMQDVTDATGRQMLDDIFEESRMRRVDVERDLQPADLADMPAPTDPYVGFFRGPIEVDGQMHDGGETLVISGASQGRTYLLKRWDARKTFKAYQITPVEGEKLRLLNVYRVMIGQKVN